METCSFRFSFLAGTSFSLPMRVGNTCYQILAFQKLVVLAYLWGMETIYDIPWQYFCYVLAYLWGMETASENNKKGMGRSFSLPMRDGNDLPNNGLRYIKRFSLPMRDGNPQKQCLAASIDFVLAYLWGMETSPYSYVMKVNLLF